MATRQELANAIRFLSMDAVQKANSGHPGAPMGMADIAQVLWHDFLKHSPSNPHWLNRDRFVLSNGHGSMLLYSLLHLTGYADMTIDEIKHFRQLHSKTPGHPEFGLTAGVETTTGPLGQGIANAVGMAIAEKVLAAQFNRPGFNIIDHHTYAFLGDGCLMEGISHECCSFAGTLGLGKLIAFWDDNGISIDGAVENWFTDNTPQRFAAYGWHVIADIDGHNPAAIAAAIEEAKNITDKPSLLCCKTQIAFGSPNFAGSHKAHGAPLGDTEIAAARKQLNWPYEPFVIPETIYAEWDAREKGAALEQQWQELFNDYKKQHANLAAELERRLEQRLPADWAEHMHKDLQTVQAKAENIATRKASQNCLNQFAAQLPELLGGSADLSESNLTFWNGAKTISKNQPAGDYLFYGVREFAMSAMMNGIALHGGFIPFGGTFLTFLDYARNAVRLSALMHQRVIYVYTHDSIALGEDGPTHQPIEHISMLRLTPNVSSWRPCDAAETAVAWQQAIERTNGPTCLLLTRQAVPMQARDAETLDQIQRGAYVLHDCGAKIDAIIIATGSEVALAMTVAEKLQQQNKAIRVVSMPSADVFAQQDLAYQEQVLPKQIKKRIAIEAGATAFWYQYVGLEGKVFGIDRFGESAPAKDVFQALGLTADTILAELSTFI